MKDIEAKSILEDELKGYRSRSYGELVELIGQTGTVKRVSPSGITYQIEVQVFWDSRRGGAVRVQGAIDDGTLRAASSPLCDDFIMGPDGSLVGE